MKGLTVNIKASPMLKQFVEYSTDDGVLRPKRGATITGLVLQYLELLPVDGDDIQPEECIKIEIPLTCRKTYSQVYGKVNWCYTLFQNKIGEKGQSIIVHYLETVMRDCFHTFMDGYTCVKEDAVKEGVTSWLLEYQIMDFTEKDIDTLAHDWHRYKRKKYASRISPLTF